MLTINDIARYYNIKGTINDDALKTIAFKIGVRLPQKNKKRFLITEFKKRRAFLDRFEGKNSRQTTTIAEAFENQNIRPRQMQGNPMIFSQPQAQTPINANSLLSVQSEISKLGQDIKGIKGDFRATIKEFAPKSSIKRADVVQNAKTIAQKEIGDTFKEIENNNTVSKKVNNFKSLSAIAKNWIKYNSGEIAESTFMTNMNTINKASEKSTILNQKKPMSLAQIVDNSVNKDILKDEHKQPELLPEPEEEQKETETYEWYDDDGNLIKPEDYESWGIE